MGKGIHPKIEHTIEMMLLNSKIGLPYYGEFNLAVNYQERVNDPNLQTAGVNVTTKGMNHYYNPKFIDSLSEKQVNFLVLHETFHLLFSHPSRTRQGGYDHKLSNIAQDMIINQILVRDIRPDFIDIPKDTMGRNTALMIPKEYDAEGGEWVFEILYNWLRDAKESSEKRRKKKEDEKIFSELFCLKNRPSSNEYTPNSYKGQFKTFVNTLEEKSKDDAELYMNNFARRVLSSILKMQPVKLIGHTSTPVPDGSPVDYNEKLSLNRAELFKNAVVETIDNNVDVYALCQTILQDEMSNIDRSKKVDFIVDYEELVNKVMVKQRKKELENFGNGQTDQVDTLFETYRFTELNKMSEQSLKNIITKKGLQMPNIQQLKLQYVQMAQNMIVVEGKAETEKIIINDENDSFSVLRPNIAHLPQYKPFASITDPEIKQKINRRVEYIFDESNDSNCGGGCSCQSENQSNRGDYGQNGANGQESYGLDQIFEDMESNNGQFMDQHIDDGVAPEMREQMIKDMIEGLRSRGMTDGNFEATIEGLRKKRKDYLKDIKRGVSFIKGNHKQRSITRPSRRGLVGIKGNKKIGSKINCILDTSGSMGGYFEKALSFIFRSDIEINLIQCDTKVHGSENIKSMADLKKVSIKGLGGTILMPGVEYIKENFPQFNTVILTDGYTDSLDFSGYKGKVLIISNGCECPISVSNGKIKQIIVDE